LKLIRVFQSGAMGPIRVYKRARPADAPKPLLDPEARHSAEVAAHEAERRHADVPVEELLPVTKSSEPE
jgi:hypothetical protein